MGAMMDSRGRTSARNLMIALRWAKQNPAGRMNFGGEWRETMTGAEFRAWFGKRLAEKVNRADPRKGWRKMADDWYWQALRTAREVNTPRRAVHWLPAEFRARLAHRLFSE